MKTLLKAAVLTLFALGLYHGNASAAEPDWAAKCSKFGALKPNENPSFQHVNCLLTSAAIKFDVPPEVVKGVASQENGSWKQFKDNGEPVISSDGGIGIMQITNKLNFDQERLKTDVYYNIEKGVEVLAYMYTRKDLPKITDTSRRDIESWYFAVMAYNGTKPINSPINKKGELNLRAYQEKVFANIENDSLLPGGGKLVKPKFNVSDFDYNPDSPANIKFLKMAYTIEGTVHTSAYFYNKGDKVATTIDGAVLRSGPGTGSTKVISLGKFSAVTITGEFVYDSSANPNQFVWIPVRTLDNKVGYISSAYVTKPVCTPCLQYHKGQKIFWDKWELVPGQLGRLTILQDTPLLTKDGKFVRTLKKGDVYRIYAFREGELSVGGGLYVKCDKRIKYETPSKAKLDAVKCIANFY